MFSQQEVSKPAKCFRAKSWPNYAVRLTIGSWRDGVCDCCRHGLFHRHLWLGMCFPLCLLGQVATRTGIWNERLQPYGISAYRLCFAITVLLTMTGAIAKYIEHMYDPNDDDYYVRAVDEQEPEPSIPFLPSVILFLCRCTVFALGMLACVATCQVRQHIRATYNIPASHPVEDFCCGCCCQSCTICQMARHTADYKRI
jgi:Cys-rich protein (TIGR01571 family)